MLSVNRSKNKDVLRWFDCRPIGHLGASSGSARLAATPETPEFELDCVEGLNARRRVTHVCAE